MRNTTSRNRDCIPSNYAFLDQKVQNGASKSDWFVRHLVKSPANARAWMHGARGKSLGRSGWRRRCSSRAYGLGSSTACTGEMWVLDAAYALRSHYAIEDLREWWQKDMAIFLVSIAKGFDGNPASPSSARCVSAWASLDWPWDDNRLKLTLSLGSHYRRSAGWSIRRLNESRTSPEEEGCGCRATLRWLFAFLGLSSDRRHCRRGLLGLGLEYAVLTKSANRLFWCMRFRHIRRS